MHPFEVYKLFPISIVKGQGSFVWDAEGNRYLDFYGGHAVISVGHSHPAYISRLKEQLDQIGFYSNSIEIPIQTQASQLIGELSGYADYDIFFCNSGAEAVENALKLASFHTNRSEVLYFENSFHGRTSLAVSVTDNENIAAPVNATSQVSKVSWNDIEGVKKALKSQSYCAVIIEAIQGVGGIHIAENEFLKELRQITEETGTVLIIDEIQSGYGRSGQFFSHQYSGIKPDLITVAKGMGNGFPVGGVFISPMFKAVPGMLGTTFGGNYLADAACLAVSEIIRDEDLIENARKMGKILIDELERIQEIEVRGRGLMIGIDLAFPAAEMRKALLFEEQIFTGNAKSNNTIRLLPPLTIQEKEVRQFLSSFKKVLKNHMP